MKKVAFLTAKPNTDYSFNGHRFATDEKRPPHGIGFLTAVLKSNEVQVDIYDRYCGNYTWPADNFKSYDLVGIYCASVCKEDFLQSIENIDNDNLAVGGPHASIFSNDFSDKVKYIVQGEAETIILDLVNHYITDRIIKTKRLTNSELDSLPRFPFEQFLENKHLYVWNFPFDTSINPVFTLNTSRSCPYDCAFCSTRKIWGRQYTYMSAERVFDDVQYCISLGAKGIYFREDNFTVKNDRVREFCMLLYKNNIRISWACETRVDTVDSDLMQLMAYTGCVGLYVGVEHLSQRMLDIYNKRITVEQIIKFFESANKYRIKTAASFVVNHPEETDEDRHEINRLLPIINPTMQWKNAYRSEG
jgi:radical SAM superfamily enzyme YgiQ (UPF0313 family)